MKNRKKTEKHIVKGYHWEKGNMVETMLEFELLKEAIDYVNSVEKFFSAKIIFCEEVIVSFSRQKQYHDRHRDHDDRCHYA